MLDIYMEKNRIKILSGANLDIQIIFIKLGSFSSNLN